MLRRICIATTLAGLVACAAAGMTSESSQPPPQTQNVKEPNTQSDEAPNEQKIAKSAWERLSIIWNRTWDDPVAFYTFVLSIFTALLAVISAVQIAFLFRADKTARMAAEAARGSLKIAHDEFNITHRPKLHVRLIRLDRIDGTQLRIHYTVVNIGEMRAFLKLHEITLCLQPANIQQGAFVECPELAEGESVIFWVPVKFDYDVGWNLAVDGEIKIRGRIEHEDATGITRRTGFFRTYDHELGHFVKSDDTEEEYED
jgi:hypothetical protein